MSDNKKQGNIRKSTENAKLTPGKNKIIKTSFIGFGFIIIILLGFFVVKSLSGGSTVKVPNSGELKIIKSDISETAKFLPYKIGGRNMEVIAVKASDGTIRTAFNTCQVCFSSERGYYKQEGNELVCQNCGNRFHIDQVEKEQNGCNPVPILDKDKTEDGTTITISNAFLNLNKDLFGNWKKE